MKNLWRASRGREGVIINETFELGIWESERERFDFGSGEEARLSCGGRCEYEISRVWPRVCAYLMGDEVYRETAAEDDM